MRLPVCGTVMSIERKNMARVVATEFLITVSMSDLIRWKDESNGVCEPAPSLLDALKEAALTVALRDLYFRYFDEIQVGRGDTYLYSSSKNVESLFAIDLYRELTDQLDLVSFGMTCSRSKASAVATHLHAFFRQASVQVSFEHSSHCVRLRKLIDPTQYPLVVQESGHIQKLITALSADTT
jgi:hypothetical protein